MRVLKNDRIVRALDQAADDIGPNGLEGLARRFKYDIKAVVKEISKQYGGIKITPNDLNIYLRSTLYVSYKGLLKYLEDETE